MKRLFIFIIYFFIFTNIASSESRFGELTEMRDEKMRGKDGQWIRPHPGPFIWNQIENEQGNFSWEEADKNVSYAQIHNQIIIATIIAILSKQKALLWVSRKLEKLDVEKNVLEGARRQTDLVPFPPPGSESIVLDRKS